MSFVTKEKFLSKDFFITYAWLIGGCFVFATGAVLFAEPYGFAPGGTYGLSMVFHNLWGWRTELAALCMDIPLLALGIYFLGAKFGVKTVICTFTIPGFMWLIHQVYGYLPLLESAEVLEQLNTIAASLDLKSVIGMEQFTIAMRPLLQEQLLSSIFGGIVYGIGIGMIFKSRATSGGSDIIAMILNKYTRMSLGQLVIIVDCTITLTTVVAFGDWRLPMYSWIIVFIEGKVIDLVLEGAKVNKTLMIISDKYDDITRIILNDLNRGGTIFHGKGMYNGAERPVIYTIVTRREYAILLSRIAEIDPDAFINVLDSNEIMGKGFKKLSIEA
ncbi:MAG: YitT family protein [Bacteroidales bacterium]|nr:YitT family protein [Bacteroidales bacterium]